MEYKQNTLSLFDEQSKNNKMSINLLSIEITQKCQMKCQHCLVGEDNNKTIDVDGLKSFFENEIIKDSFINTIGFTGGEPFLNIEAISDTLNLIKNNNIKVNNVFIRTNGLSINKRVIDVMNDWFDYVENKRFEYSVLAQNGVLVSVDYCHKFIPYYIKDKLSKIPWLGFDIVNFIDLGDSEREIIRIEHEEMVSRYGDERIFYTDSTLQLTGRTRTHLLPKLLSDCKHPEDVAYVMTKIEDENRERAMSNFLRISYKHNLIAFMHICCDGKITNTSNILNDYSDRTDNIIIGDISNKNWLKDAYYSNKTIDWNI